MKETPILFSAPMVRALLEGRKTQTRRCLKHQEFPAWGLGEELLTTCPYGKIGDHMWVRETFAHGNFEGRSGVVTNYLADYKPAEEDDEWEIKWKPSIHMPRDLSRITLEITEVRVQRLQEISEDDARVEGLSRYLDTSHTLEGWRGVDESPIRIYPRAAFCDLWESLNGIGSWAANPWLWAITFRRVEQA